MGGGGHKHAIQGAVRPDHCIIYIRRTISILSHPYKFFSYDLPYRV